MTAAIDAITVIEPTTGQALREIPRADVEDADAAVARTKTALPGWRSLPAAERARRLMWISAAALEQLEPLATLEARNAGKPISDARGKITMVAEVFRYCASAPERLLGETIPVPGGVDMTFCEPMGVIGLITPDADLEAAAEAAPAAAFGNADQDCCARSRILVQRSVMERFLELFERSVRRLRVSDPLQPTTQMGPLISASNREKVASYLRDGLPVAFTGTTPEGPGS